MLRNKQSHTFPFLMNYALILSLGYTGINASHDDNHIVEFYVLKVTYNFMLCTVKFMCLMTKSDFDTSLEFQMKYSGTDTQS